MKSKKLSKKIKSFKGATLSVGEQNKVSRPLEDVPENRADKTLAKLKGSKGSFRTRVRGRG